MGKINQGILGGVSGKVGGVVGTSWKGIAVLKAMPISVANPKTAAQVNNRNRNTGVLRFAQGVGTTFIRTYWNRFAKKMSGFNDFMSTNYVCYDPATSTYLPAYMFTSVGKLEPMFVAGCVATHGANIVTSFIARTSSADYTVGDLVDVAVYNTTKQDGVVKMDIAASFTSATIAAPSTWEVGDVIVAFVSCRRADGTAVSTSKNVEIEMV